jgi:hypothetical protein
MLLLLLVQEVLLGRMALLTILVLLDTLDHKVLAVKHKIRELLDIQVIQDLLVTQATKEI